MSTTSPKYELNLTNAGGETRPTLDPAGCTMTTCRASGRRLERILGNKSASSRFAKTSREKLGHEGDEEDEDAEGQTDDGEDDAEDRTDDENDRQDQSDSKVETDEGNNINTFEGLSTVEPFRALKRPPLPRRLNFSSVKPRARRRSGRIDRGKRIGHINADRIARPGRIDPGQRIGHIDANGIARSGARAANLHVYSRSKGQAPDR
ncbi:hypothetical protein TI39_contig4336g00003 [Zymoseptoria brevis]|uniref:Uncharacterized protein n=1 Tax=Zymoseptoria brevis TaxID=1047168 RepID=A0A0F4G8H9_9PEZI|nr:hypothetical protein TI39_contig4336g00003 [Zymoseptoria brevis]